ncbi:MAG: acyl-CoA dehydrogenase family protein [Deltaproteobacteria bacterium]|nr:acyl-CoA dehydrogenase family protein [Deltaproteobacteria bacterium]
MDFNDTPEEAAFRAEARAWLEANAELRDPDERYAGILQETERPEKLKWAQEWQKKKADAGWACITWPVEYGGRGASSIQSVIWGQEEAKFKTPPPVFSIGIGMCGPTILTHGTDEQKARWIPKLVSGEEIWCQLFSEPNAGSDLAGLRMTAVRDGDDWVVNGQKIWTTGAQFCDWGILVTRHDANVPKHAGLTYFVVDMHSPGIEVRKITQINKATAFNEVFYSDVRIPDANRIGAVGDGWRVAITTLMNERASIGGGGGAGDPVAELIGLAQEIEIDGRPALEDASVRQRIADFYIKRKGIQYTSYRTLTALSQGKIPGPEASMGKLVGAKLMQEMGSFGMDLAGVAGSLNKKSAPGDGSWQAQFLAAPGLRIAGGTDEILRNIIAERVLRLPPETRLDKEVAFRDVPSGSA